MQHHTPEQLKPTATLHVIFHVPYRTDDNIRHKTSVGSIVTFEETIDFDQF